jgi:hypothetical protein
MKTEQAVGQIDTAAFAGEQRQVMAEIAALNMPRRNSRREQDPVAWGTELAQAGMPLAAAKIMAELVSVIFKRLSALEAAQYNSTPRHMQGVERRG